MKPAPEKAGRKQANLPADLVELTPRQKRAARLPRFEGAGNLVTTKDQLETLKDELHTDHGEVLRGAVATSLCGDLAQEGERACTSMNTALQLLVELQPQSALERMLVAQFIACDRAASQCLNIGFNPPNDANAKRKYLGLAVQFQGLIVRQVEALAKLRNGGGQTVRVEHVHVHQGGQAIVGNVQGGGGGDSGR